MRGLRESRPDRGVRASRIAAVDAMRRRWQAFITKAEYAYDYGMPSWLVGIDRRLRPLRPERLFLGRQKFSHFRVWYRDRLAHYVQETLLDDRSLGRPYVRKLELEKVVSAHVRGTGNDTLEIRQQASHPGAPAADADRGTVARLTMVTHNPAEKDGAAPASESPRPGAPHISVCVCTFRRPELLRRALETLLQQRTEGRFTFSIVVSDNDAKQSSRQVAAAFAGERAIEVVYTSEPRQNIALARTRPCATRAANLPHSSTTTSSPRTTGWRRC